MTTQEACEFLWQAKRTGYCHTPLGALRSEKETKEVARKRGGTRTAKFHSLTLNDQPITQRAWVKMGDGK